MRDQEIALGAQDTTRGGKGLRPRFKEMLSPECPAGERVGPSVLRFGVGSSWGWLGSSGQQGSAQGGETSSLPD